MRKVKKLQLAIGSDMLGSTTSFAHSSNTSLFEGEKGIEIHSNKTGRHVVIPYPNCKAYEILIESAAIKPVPPKR